MKRVITIIYFTDNAGKAHTIEFSLKSLISLAAGFFILMLILIASAAFSLKLYVEKNRLSNELASAAAEKNSSEEKLEKMEAKVNKREAIAAPAADLTTNLQTKEKKADRKIGEKIEPLSLHGFQVKKTKEGDRFVIAFDLVKTNSIGGISQGYIFIVGDYGGRYSCFPEGIEMKDGSPVDFKKGDRFSIKWQKHMEQTFPLSMDNAIKAVTVFVFSPEGNLLIKKEAAL